MASRSIYPGPAFALRASARSRRSLGGGGLLILTMLASSVPDAGAQTSTGGLRGFVKDDTGGVLVGVTVEASSPARIGRPALEVTDTQGLYTFQNLPIGEYALTFSLQGFTTVRRESVRVEVGRTIQVDVSLDVGSLEQAVTVTGGSSASGTSGGRTRRGTSSTSSTAGPRPSPFRV